MLDPDVAIVISTILALLFVGAIVVTLVITAVYFFIKERQPGPYECYEEKTVGEVFSMAESLIDGPLHTNSIQAQVDQDVHDGQEKIDAKMTAFVDDILRTIKTKETLNGK